MGGGSIPLDNRTVPLFTAKRTRGICKQSSMHYPRSSMGGGLLKVPTSLLMYPRDGKTAEPQCHYQESNISRTARRHSSAELLRSNLLESGTSKTGFRDFPPFVQANYKMLPGSVPARFEVRKLIKRRLNNQQQNEPRPHVPEPVSTRHFWLHVTR